MDRPPRFLPDDLGIGRAGLEERLHDAVAASHAESMPTIGTDWGLCFEKAGFMPIDARTFSLDVRAPLPAATPRYARTYLRRVRPTLDGRFTKDDLDTSTPCSPTADCTASSSAATSTSPARAAGGWSASPDRGLQVCFGWESVLAVVIATG